MTFKTWLRLAVSAALIAGQTLWAMDDFDAEVEESMFESDAASEVSKVQRARAEKESAETARLKAEATRAKAQALEKQKHALSEVQMAEKEIKDQRDQQVKAKQDKVAMDKAVASAEAKLKGAQWAVNKLKGENEALAKLRQEQVLKLTALEEHIRLISAENKKLQEQMEAAKKEFDKGKLEIKAGEQRLEKAKVEEARKRAQIQQQIENYKMLHRGNKEKLAKLEEQVAEKNRSAAKMDAEVKVAESETRASEMALRAAQSRLAKTPLMRETASGPGDAGSKKVLRTDCRAYERADEKSKILGMKRAGTGLAVSPQGSWMVYRLKDNRAVYLNRSCF